MSFQSDTDINNRIWTKYYAMAPDKKLNFTSDMKLIQPLIDQHKYWCFKRNGFEHWEVRFDLSGRTMVDDNLTRAICKALLEEEKL